jgi:hypothetical protein
MRRWLESLNGDAAMPPDVRKRFALPSRYEKLTGCARTLGGAQN